MTLGGGAYVAGGRGRVRGPGHNGIFVAGDTRYLVHQFCDAEDNGRSKLQIRPIACGSDGWPFAGEPRTPPE